MQLFYVHLNPHANIWFPIPALAFCKEMRPEEIRRRLILLSEGALQESGTDMAIIQIRQTSGGGNNGGFVLLFKIMPENTRHSKIIRVLINSQFLDNWKLVKLFGL